MTEADKKENKKGKTAKKDETKVPKVVTMEDGTSVNFGFRNNILSSFDVDTCVIQFKIITGQVVNWTPKIVAAFTEVNNLPDYTVNALKKITLYGLLAKIKNTLATVKVEELATHINKQIADIDEGKFAIRSYKEEGVATLEPIHRAYAAVKAAVDPEHFGHWASLDSQEIIDEVVSTWEALPPSSKQINRRNSLIIMELAKLSTEKELAASLV